VVLPGTGSQALPMGTRGNIGLGPLEGSWTDLTAILHDVLGRLREALARLILVAQPVVAGR
jgi:hypothetical protein